MFDDDEKKKLYTYAALIALLFGGGSTALNKFTADVRKDPFTGEQGQEHSDRIGKNTENINILSRLTESYGVRLAELERNKVSKEYFKQRCEDMIARVKTIEDHDERLLQDVRTLYTLVNSLPPRELLKRVTALEVKIDHYIQEKNGQLRNR